MSEHLLDVRDLCISFVGRDGNALEAVNKLNLHIDAGEIVGVVGESGCGKSVFAQSVMRLLEHEQKMAYTGQILFDGEDLLARPLKRMREVRGCDIAMIFQDPLSSLNPVMTVGAQVIEAVRAHRKVSRREARNEALSLLERVGIRDAAARFDMYPGDFSGGMRQRVALIRTLATGPDILLLDEPTNHLDLQATEWLEEYIRTFRGTVVTISHDRYFLDRTVTRIIEVLDGKAEFYSGNYSFYAVEKERRYQERLKQYLKEQAKIQQLEKAAEQMHLWAFMGNDALHKRAFSMEKRIQRMRTTEKPTKAKKMDARFASRQFKGDEVLQVKGVSKAFDGRTLFSDTYLRVENGERIALIGENGTGKTTLLNMLLGLEPTDSGIFKLGPSVKAAYLPQIIHFDHPERSRAAATPEMGMVCSQIRPGPVRTVLKRPSPPNSLFFMPGT